MEGFLDSSTLFWGASLGGTLAGDSLTVVSLLFGFEELGIELDSSSPLSSVLDVPELVSVGVGFAVDCLLFSVTAAAFCTVGLSALAVASLGFYAAGWEFATGWVGAADGYLVGATYSFDGAGACFGGSSFGFGTGLAVSIGFWTGASTFLVGAGEVVLWSYFYAAAYFEGSGEGDFAATFFLTSTFFPSALGWTSGFLASSF